MTTDQLLTVSAAAVSIALSMYAGVDLEKSQPLTSVSCSCNTDDNIFEHGVHSSCSILVKLSEYRGRDARWRTSSILVIRCMK